MEENKDYIRKQLTDEEIAFIKSLVEQKTKASPGYIVKTKTGLLGRTYHNEEQVDGKKRIHCVDKKLLCDPKTLTVIGFID